MDGKWDVQENKTGKSIHLGIDGGEWVVVHLFNSMEQAQAWLRRNNLWMSKRHRITGPKGEVI